MKKGIFCLFSTILLALGMISCGNVGLGEQIDLEAPVLTITSPKHGGFAPQTVTLTGTVKDNKEVESVEVKYRYKENNQFVTGSKNATINGTDWTCTFSFDKGYEVEFEAYAYDKMRNGSDDSHARLMVIIDPNDPDSGKFTIVRGDYVAKLLPLKDFTDPENGRTARRGEPQNKDYFQNEKFSLRASLKDEYGIGESYVKLFEVSESGVESTESFLTVYPKDDENPYYPEFEIKEEDLPESFKTGIHYIRPIIYVFDKAGNSINDEEKTINSNNVVAWESAYNKPHVIFRTIDPDLNTIIVETGGNIPVSVFDDDNIQSVQYKFIDRSTFGSINLSSITGFTDVYNSTGAEDRTRDIQITDIGVGNTDGAFNLVVKIVDKSGRDDGIYLSQVPVKVTDGGAPTIFVNEPEENSVPTVTLNTTNSEYEFTIKGKITDNQPVEKIAIVWLPNGNDDVSAARTFFKGDAEGNNSFDNYGDGAAEKTVTATLSNGTQITINILTKATANGHEFTKTFALSDFKKGGTQVNEQKVFMIVAKDTTANVTTKEFRLSKFSEAPTVEIEYTQDREAKKSDSPVIIFKPNVAAKLEFTPKAARGLDIKSCTITGDDSTQKAIGANLWTEGKINLLTNKSITIPQDEAKSGRTMNFSIEVEDVIGLKITQPLTLLFEEVGTLESITCNSNEGNTFKEEDIIRLQANFTGKVTANSDSYIQLDGTKFKYKNGTEVPAEKRWAKFEKGSETNTLYFSYQVPKDVEATDIKLASSIKGSISGVVKSLEELNTVDTATGKKKNEVDDKKYKIDSIAPYITEYSPDKNGVVAKKSDGSIDIKLTFNEPVTAESGTITMQRTANWYIPPILSEDVFLKIWNEAKANERKILCGSDTSVFKYGKDENGIDTLIPEGPYMQYTNGLVEKGEKMVPNLSTKYVLAYTYRHENENENLKIGDTTGTVAKIRNVLENHNYHKTTFEADVVAMSNDNKTVTLKVKDSDFIGGLVNGVEYFLTISKGAFRDEAYNETEELGENIYKFWVGPVATPVIRVNRTATNKYDSRPTGKTSVKIDCETPGATVKYFTKNNSITGATGSYDTVGKFTITDENNKKIKYLNYGKLDAAADLASDLKNSTANTNITLTNGTSGEFNVGDGNITTAQKIFIKATATKTGMTAASGYEGAFKTVLHAVEPAKYRLKWCNTVFPKRDNNGNIEYEDIKDNNENVVGQKMKYEGSMIPIKNWWDQKGWIKWDDDQKANIHKYEKNEFLGYSGDDFRVFGTQTPEGVSYTPGWPLTQNGENREQYQVAWRNGNASDYYWVSWQILDNFTLQTFLGGIDSSDATKTTNQEHANPSCTYGQYIYYYQMQYWTWGEDENKPEHYFKKNTATREMVAGKLDSDYININ